MEEQSASCPIATCALPVVLLSKEFLPIAVLFVPAVLEYNAFVPFAVLFTPVVLNRNALTPKCCQMCAPIPLRDIIGKALHTFLV